MHFYCSSSKIGTIWIIAIVILSHVDTNRLYHIIKSQSIIKLYIFYNMLEVGDRLLCAFGQDAIDALFWTATEPKDRNRSRLSITGHAFFALFYVVLHSSLIMFQCISLNVAINSDNKGLLGIMMSNNFVELKGSVFKKFDKNNLFQLTCSDVRERVHLTVLLFVVVIQTMKEFNWCSEQFLVLASDCFFVLMVEFLIDWIKHAFITRFNELPADVYKEFTVSLAYDMTQTRQKHAFSDHSDLVARRMGFIPFPLGVVLVKALYSSIPIDSLAAVILLAIAFITLLSCRILNTICSLGKACDLLKTHQKDKHPSSSSTSTSNGSNSTSTPVGASAPIPSNLISPLVIGGIQPLPNTPTRNADLLINNTKTDQTKQPNDSDPKSPYSDKSTPNNSKLLNDPNLGATALFSNSDVDLDDVCLNDCVLNDSESIIESEQVLTRSVPDLQQESEHLADDGNETVPRRTHKRSESEPFIHAENGINH